MKNKSFSGKCEILPSLFAAPPLHLADALQKIETSGYRSVHFDIMDGHFVPNMSFGPEVVTAAREEFPSLFREVHLMVTHPPQWIESFYQSGAQRIFIHLEIEPSILQQSIQLLQQKNIPWGFAIHPETSLESLQTYIPWLHQTDRLLVMSVYPGFSGQSYLSQTDERISFLRKRFPFLSLCIDGGLDSEHIQRLQTYGVSSFVVGSCFFKTENNSACCGF